ncbi:YbaB/EbfC family nucleoid-associated protein [Actinopolymorpha alba]|uniref:YbaB/EbfC family nucleoid-associated protein n=1 Tax=Actinopolymorpha alba TaxID=533267 RepID=UPI000366F93A|nr:YbaB/EbfC family nucleoid-associated protein [Actinopolymorpha alba]
MNLDAIMNEIGRSIAEMSEQVEEHRIRSFEGTAADDLVKATVTNGQLEIDIHVLAKRRLEREELAASVVEAVREADRQTREATFTTSLQRRADSSMSDSFDRMFKEAMERFTR